MPMKQTLKNDWGNYQRWVYPEHLRGEFLVFLDAIGCGRFDDVRHIFTTLNVADPPDLMVLGGCGCDFIPLSKDPLQAPLWTFLEDRRYCILAQVVSNDGYEHTYNAVLITDEGQIIHADCGGCSCGGSGSWGLAASYEDGLRMIPEIDREIFSE